MSRKIQLAALILGMFLVGVERLTAVASPAASPDNPPLADGGVPVPRPPAAQ